MFNKEEKKVAEELSNSSNTIGKGTTVEGNIETYGNLRVDGRVVGNIVTKSKLVLGQTSQVDGNILTQNAEVFGEIKGKIEVSDLLVLKASSVVHGDILTNKLVVETGATFNGGCKMGSAVKEIKIGENGQQNSIKQQEVKTA
ncbi:MAG: cell shape determination protein CcmA [Bacteroidetes bacterium]|jgi:cytoskeletal protein CcmA (bactofilin family)|nr:MAG: cell shape determination protein CcmA [Bacteroidota bacterium]